MGLLDDAIREHLELKRRRGADPGEVAREQREALNPIGGEVSAEDDAAIEPGSGQDATSGAPLVDPVTEQAAQSGELPPAAAAAGPVGAADPTPAAGAGETAELDMTSVLGENTEQATEGAGSQEPTEGDSLEWEMPGEAAAQAAAAEEPDEDVLEETPDFLRDTPEQDRLWFEQRPPRDFDFDK